MAQSPVTNAPSQGAALLKTDLMGVFAHPDDETGAAGTLATYALGRGAVIANVYCTRGQGGGNMVGTQAGPALGILREAELRQCLEKLGVRFCYFLDQADFAYTESLAITLEKWGHEELLRRLVRHVRALRPEIILTMNPAPSPGQHGNHQAAGLLAIEAFSAAADPTRFSEQLKDEGLTVWQVRKLYYGGPAGTGATIDVNQPLPEGRSAGQVAGAALSHHRSQGFGGFMNSPWLRRPQNWTLVQSVVPFAADETDLFRGLPVAGETIVRQFAAGDRPEKEAFQARFVPRPAVEFYEKWIKAQQIGHVAQAFAADLPVVAGEANPVLLELANTATRAEELRIELSAPDGWLLESTLLIPAIPPGQSRRVPVPIQPPAGQRADVEVTARVIQSGQPITAVARLHPVPRLSIPRLASLLPVNVDGAEVHWATLPRQGIPPSNTWEGSVTNAADSSGEFRLAHDGVTLFIEVRVRDNAVVSNIEPNDIKGHWRSDSIELCFDPTPGSSHTLGCFKLGIFPFDTTGRVRAGRDADARPGLVEETAPGTRLVSWRTPDGYAIRAGIPLVEIGGVGAVSGRRLGFNVLIYDGDKTDAAPGENINRSRLAWAPRSGVQGRPEDWGRADLE